MTNGNGRIPPQPEWSFPDVIEGDFVLVRACPSSHDPTLAIITKRKSQGVDVLCIGTNGMVPRRNCWHQEDPRCETHSHVFDQGDRGVFELTRGELHRRDLQVRMDAMEQLVDELVGQVAGVVEAQKIPPQTPAGRGPYSPKKQTRKG